MRLLTERALVKSMAQRHRSAYSDPNYRFFDGKTVGETQKALDALDVEKATATDVEAVIGNRSWVAPTECHECGTETWDAVEIGQEPDYESATASICLSCLEKAVALIRGAAPEKEHHHEQ